MPSCDTSTSRRSVSCALPKLGFPSGRKLLGLCNGSFNAREIGRGTILASSATAAFRGSARGPGFPMSKFALRALTQSIAKEHAKDGIHCVSIRLDCVLDNSAAKYGIPKEKSGSTADVAETYYFLAQQKPGCWTNEIDLRPNTEGWTF